MNYNNWNTDLSDSIKALSKIKDTVLPNLISGNIYCIESSDDFVLMKLDAYCGIDYIREDKIGLQGIAARVQWGRAWNTFTIREERHTGTKTELAKRIEQIENGYFYPAYTLQAYFDNREDNNLLSIAVVKTKDLYKYVEENKQYLTRRESDNKFIAVPWSRLEYSGVAIKRHPKQYTKAS